MMISCLQNYSSTQEPVLYLFAEHSHQEVGGDEFRLVGNSLVYKHNGRRIHFNDGSRDLSAQFAVSLKQQRIIHFTSSSGYVVVYDTSGKVQWKKHLGGGEPSNFLVVGDQIVYIPDAPWNTGNAYQMSEEEFLRSFPNDIQVIARSLATGKQLSMKPLYKVGLPLVPVSASEYLALMPHYHLGSAKPTYSLQIRRATDSAFVASMKAASNVIQALAKGYAPYGNPTFYLDSSVYLGQRSIHRLRLERDRVRDKHGKKIRHLRLIVDRNSLTVNLVTFQN